MHKDDEKNRALGPNCCHMCYLLIGKRKSVAEVLLLLKLIVVNNRAPAGLEQQSQDLSPKSIPEHTLEKQQEGAV